MTSCLRFPVRLYGVVMRIALLLLVDAQPKWASGLGVKDAMTMPMLVRVAAKQLPTGAVAIGNGRLLAYNVKIVPLLAGPG